MTDLSESVTEPRRVLASIQLVGPIYDHQNAHSLVLVNILGWQIVTRKDEVEPDQPVVYLEIDSLLDPEANWLSEGFVSKAGKKQGRFHVRTIRIRGEYSQGLIVPLNQFEDGLRQRLEKYPAGYNVTEILGVSKYVPPLIKGKMTGKRYVTGQFPSHMVCKTEELRVQSNPHLLDLLVGRPAYAAVKMDGTSVTYLIDDHDEFVVCSRNYSLKRPDDISKFTQAQPYWPVAYQYSIERLLRSYQENHDMRLAIQGEICGPSFMRNLIGLKTNRLYVFNIVSIDNHRKLNYQQTVKVCKELGLEMVPVVEIYDSFPGTTIPELLKMSEGKYTGTKNPREGLVFRSQDQLLSFKVINNSYLIKIKM